MANNTTEYDKEGETTKLNGRPVEETGLQRGRERASN
jgi:hypothetical protein